MEELGPFLFFIVIALVQLVKYLLEKSGKGKQPPGQQDENAPPQKGSALEEFFEGLAEKLDDNPNDPEGWARLIRARTVLGQEKKLQADIDRVKLIFKDSPETVEKILGSPN